MSEQFDTLDLAMGLRDPAPATEVRRITLDGKRIVLYLSAEHAAHLDNLLAPYIDAALKRRALTRVSYSREEREKNHRIREWARANGYDIGSGRGGAIPPEVRIAYETRDIPVGH
jgi:hypothetical protein